jgi:hypothetical protein
MGSNEGRAGGQKQAGRLRRARLAAGHRRRRVTTLEMHLQCNVLLGQVGMLGSKSGKRPRRVQVGTFGGGMSSDTVMIEDSASRSRPPRGWRAGQCPRLGLLLLPYSFLALISIFFELGQCLVRMDF